jgi:large subunit ribosomal protein L2
VKPGNAMPLGNMPVGTIVHNVEMKPGKGGQIARSAGTYAQIVGRDQGYVILRLNSGEQRLVHGQCWPRSARCRTRPHEHLDRQGRPQPLARRMPHNRGVAMNPVDHPHGGGEGRTSGGRHPVTPVGQADQGQEDPVEQVDRQVHRAQPSRAQEEEEEVRPWHVRFGKARSSTAIC